MQDTTSVKTECIGPKELFAGSVKIVAGQL